MYMFDYDTRAVGRSEHRFNMGTWVLHQHQACSNECVPVPVSD
jgi:hypothetical protein